MLTVDDYKEKIKKLLALAQSPSEAEAKAALLKARKLMAEYKLTEADLKEAEEQPVKDILTDITCSKRRDPWIVNLSTIIGRNYCCQVYIRRNKHKQTILIGFIGLENDVEVCVNIFKYAVEVVLAEIKRIMKEDPCHSENAGVSYGYGFCAGLHKAFKKQQEENQNEWGLVLVLPKAVAEATGHLTKKPFNARSQENITPDNYMKGYIEGEKFSINRLAERKQA